MENTTRIFMSCVSQIIMVSSAYLLGKGLSETSMIVTTISIAVASFCLYMSCAGE